LSWTSGSAAGFPVNFAAERRAAVAWKEGNIIGGV
jgi:hypothetical protein